jgi:putative hydrolase of the HAD superfamily
VGGTLIECWPSVGDIYAEEAARYGFVGICPDLLNQRFAQAWGELRGFQHTASEWRALVDRVFLGLTERAPSETFFPRLFERFAQADAWRIYDDVLPALDTLASRGLKLGVISNWDHRLRPLLTSLNLHSYFQTIVVSCEVGAPKPAGAIFAAAVSSLGLPHGAILHVGDSAEMDVLGARAAGLQAVLLRRATEPAGPGGIRSLLELRTDYNVC